MLLFADQLLCGDRRTVLPQGGVRLEGGRITAVDTQAALLAAYPDEPVVRYPGCTLLPGLIDLHVHLACPPDPDYYGKPDSVSLRALYAAGRMRDTLAAGVTTIRDCCSADGIGTALKRAAADGHIRAPRIFACLQGICMTGGHGADMHDSVMEADGVEAVRRAVRLNCKRGADCIKVLTSEGYRGQELNQEELSAIAAEAHRFGKKAAAHAGYGDSIEMCIEAGFDSIEHGTHLTVEQARRMKARNITWVPTVLVFNYVHQASQKSQAALGGLKDKPAVNEYLAEAVATYQKNLRAVYDTGVRVAAGTDTDCTDYRGASPVALECRALVDCGLTPLEAVECATKNGADCLGLGGSLGQLKPGFLADLLAVRGDPAADIAALTQVEAVYQGGERVV